MDSSSNFSVWYSVCGFFFSFLLFSFFPFFWTFSWNLIFVRIRVVKLSYTRDVLHWRCTCETAREMRKEEPERVNQWQGRHEPSGTEEEQKWTRINCGNRSAQVREHRMVRPEKSGSCNLFTFKMSNFRNRPIQQTWWFRNFTVVVFSSKKINHNRNHCRTY